MLPPPPELSKAAKEWKDEELFWIVKHGIKYTGMPSWVAAERDDEVWSVVAFLKRLKASMQRATVICCLAACKARRKAVQSLQLPDPTATGLVPVRAATVPRGAPPGAVWCRSCTGSPSSS